MKRDYWEIVQAMPAAALADLMHRFEDLGLYGIWSPQLHAPPFPTLAAAAMVTSKLKLGTGIALAFVRSCQLLAQTTHDYTLTKKGGKPVLEHARQRVQRVKLETDQPSMLPAQHAGHRGDFLQQTH